MLATLREVLALPQLTVDLQWRHTERNAPFFRNYTRQFYEEARQRHPRFPLVRRYSIGFAIHALEKDFEAYFMAIEAAARRNWKKAQRHQFRFQAIDFNERLPEIREIVSSTEVRQGKVPDRLLKGEIHENTNPPSLDSHHDYPFFGVLNADGKLCAYAGCFLCGDICLIETIYGHADYQQFGIVPLLIIEIARQLIDHHPEVPYYAYGTYYGASESLRRFKRKFGFHPARVQWKLG